MTTKGLCNICKAPGVTVTHILLRDNIFIWTTVVQLLVHVYYLTCSDSTATLYISS